MKVNDRLAALAVGKRSAVLSVWRGLDLVHTRHLQFHSDMQRAIASVTHFLLDSLERFEIVSVALERPVDQTTRKGILLDHIRNVCRQEMLSLVEVSYETLQKESWAVGFNSRAQLRTTALSLWPVLADSRLRQLTCDSALLGLFAQSQRLIQSHLANQ